MLSFLLRASFFTAAGDSATIAPFLFFLSGNEYFYRVPTEIIQTGFLPWFKSSHGNVVTFYYLCDQ